MFENLLYQDDIAGRLRRDVTAGTLPPSLLFAGPGMSGKLTAALELARTLSCRRTGAWNCPCHPCRSHRALAHPWTLLAGNRELGPEIAAAAEVLRRDRGDGSRFLLVRSARRLLRRFDPVLWEGEEKKISKARPLMERLSEVVDSIVPGAPLPDGGTLERTLDSLVDDCIALHKFLPGVLPVAQVRHISSWAVHSPGRDHKTVIIDAADRMPDAGRNALLKFLEEPPGNTTVILITDRKSLLLPTIVSRLRSYEFRYRKASEEAEVLRRVFREDQRRYGGLADYFRAWRSGPSERLKSLAVDFIDLARSENPLFPGDFDQIEDQVDLVAFLEAMSGEMRRRWRESEGDGHQERAREMARLRDARIRAESLNFPIHLILRGLFASLGSPE